MDPALPAAPTGADIADVVRAALLDTYARPLVREASDGLVAVLAGKALDRARAAALEALGPEAEARVVALDVSALPWFAVPAGGVRLWRQHGRSGADGEVVTELEAGDPPVQVVVSDAGWLLLRTVDGAQGWIETGSLDQPVAAPDAADLEDASSVDVERFVATLLSFEGVPYVWGGTSDAGVDCSGIVQRAAWRAGSTWLPRHSKAMLRAGRRVSPKAVERGDVLVLQRDPSTYAAEQAAQLAAQAELEQLTGRVPAHGPAIHPMHVAVALSPSEALHASRDTMRVAREPLESLLARYRVLGVRRLGAAPTEGDQA